MTGRALWVRTGCTHPYTNLAREELLMQAVQPGECILYLWQNRHTVVIGRNQDCWKECDVEALEADGGYLARRLSGGGAVYHDLGNLNFTFLACRAGYDVARQLSVIVEACRILGICAEVSGRNDLTVDGRKFSGNAFYESGGRCYHHGTLLLRADFSRMSRFLNVSQDKLERKGVPSVRARVVNLCEFYPALTVDLMCDTLLSAFQAVYGTPVVPFPAGRLDETAVAGRAAFYASDQWRLNLKRPSNLRLSHRFPWGDFQLYATVEDGRLSGVRAYSDAMDCGLIGRLPQVLEGVRFSAQEMTAAVCAADGDPRMAADLAAYLRDAGTADPAGF